MPSTLRTLPALTLLYASSVDAFWRMNCAIIQRGRIDTLVNPGTLSGHAHQIVGGSNFGVNATFNSLLNSQCTSCEIASDKSAYWTPSLYYSYPNGSFLEVPNGGKVAYYLGRGPNVDQTIPFPKGLNILSGDMTARSYDSKAYTWGNATYPGRPIADRASFNCITDPPLAEPEKNYMFQTDCKNGLRAQIHFQSCWNGKDLYKADNSHVAYQSAIDNGICPPTHPFQLPHLFLETLYGVNDIAKVPGGRFVFSQGDPTGYGMHGDFQNGWETAALANAVKNCLATDNEGQISACPILQSTQSDGFPWNCPERPQQVGEAVTGLISKLPGCITITEGPEAAPMASMKCGADVPKPAITRTVDSTSAATVFPNPGQAYGLTVDQKYVGCFNDSPVGVRALNAISTSNYTAMTIEYCQTYCKARGYRLSGVEYAQECHCDNAINPNSIGGQERCSWNCGGTMTKGGAQQICGGNAMVSIYNNTDPTFNATGSNDNSAGNVKPEEPLSPFPSNYAGCATDNLNNAGRALTGPNTAANGMTGESCRAFCASQGPLGFQYYGTEYGTQCFCGNAVATPNYITNLTSTVTNATCNMRCGGAGDELCGGPNAISLYRNVTYTPPKIKSPIGKYVTKQCLTDPAGGANRALLGPSITSDTLTEDSCVKYCLGQRQHYAAMEYGKECYCGNNINAAGGARQINCQVANLMTCAGNPLQYCGGSNLMNLYYSATL